MFKSFIKNNSEMNLQTMQFFIWENVLQEPFCLYITNSNFFIKSIYEIIKDIPKKGTLITRPKTDVSKISKKNIFFNLLIARILSGNFTFHFPRKISYID